MLSGGPGVVTLGRGHRPQADAALLVAVVMVRLPASILNKILTKIVSHSVWWVTCKDSRGKKCLRIINDGNIGTDVASTAPGSGRGAGSRRRCRGTCPACARSPGYPAKFYASSWSGVCGGSRGERREVPQLSLKCVNNNSIQCRHDRQ